MQENENVRNIDVSITFPDKNSSKQEHDEVAILLFRKNNDKIRDTINNYLGIDSIPYPIIKCLLYCG